MATLASNNLTLADWAKRLDPEGKTETSALVELLSQTNEMLTDMVWREGNLPTGHRTTVRTGLPTVAWRLLNQGVATSKSTTAQIDEGLGKLTAWSEVDTALADLNGNTADFRLSEATAFIEAMNQEMAQTVIYGNSGTAPEEFTGLAARYSSLSAGNGQNIVSGGGSGSDNTSIWFMCWGDNTVHGIFPKGSPAGLRHQDYGAQTSTITAGIGGQKLRVYQDEYIWDAGIVLKDWRYVVRIANIDVSALVAESSAANLIKLMIKASYRIFNPGMGRCAWYMNRTVAQMLDIQRYNTMGGLGSGTTTNGGSIQYQDIDGKVVSTFRNYPIRIVDSILETESAVS